MAKLLKTKTFWLGLASVVWGILTGVQSNNWELAVPEITLGLLAVTGRHAVAKLEK